MQKADAPGEGDPDLIYRDDFSGPHDRAEVSRLLQDTFGLDLAPLDELNLGDPSYRAFSYFDAAGCCVANAATFVLPLVINGRRVDAMGVQSVATRPAYRGRGLSRRLLDRALRWCDANAGLVFLMTSIPGFYEPLGFRIVPQFACVGAPPPIPPAAPSRRLDLGLGDDRRLLVELLHRRSPVSSRFAIVGSAGDVFLNLIGEPELCAWHLPAHDAVVVTRQKQDDTFCLVDVVAAEMPELAQVLASLDVRPRRVEVHFPSDRLAWSGTATLAETPTVLMARGDAGPLPPFMLPETAAF